MGKRSREWIAVASTEREVVVAMGRGAAEELSADPKMSVVEVVERAAGALVRSVSDAEEDAVLLRFQRWDHFLALGRYVVVVNLSLVVVARLADRPEFVGLAALIDRQARGIEPSLAGLEAWMAAQT